MACTACGWAPTSTAEHFCAKCGQALDLSQVAVGQDFPPEIPSVGAPQWKILGTVVTFVLLAVLCAFLAWLFSSVIAMNQDTMARLDAIDNAYLEANGLPPRYGGPQLTMMPAQIMAVLALFLVVGAIALPIWSGRFKRQMKAANAGRGGTSWLAVSGFVSSFFLPVVPIVLSKAALMDIEARGRTGKGLAVASLVLGWLGLLGYAAWAMLVMWGQI